MGRARDGSGLGWGERGLRVVGSSSAPVSSNGAAGVSAAGEAALRPPPPREPLPKAVFAAVPINKEKSPNSAAGSGEATGDRSGPEVTLHARTHMCTRVHACGCPLPAAELPLAGAGGAAATPVLSLKWEDFGGFAARQEPGA